MAISSNGVAGLRTGVCTSSTRPSGPYEGQMIYETDTDMVAIWNGTAWRYISATTPTNGTVLQVVNATYATETDSTTSTFADTGLTASITPKSTSSKILVTVSLFCFKSLSNAGNAVGTRIVRGSTVLVTYPYNLYTGTAIESYGTVTMQWLDSPSTTSSTSYKVQFSNNPSASLARVQAASNASVITLQEIAG